MNKNGIALIMAVGVLALLAIIATSFALNMRLEYHAAMNYYSGVKARCFAEAALQRAIAELRTHVKISAFDDTTEAWSLAGYSNNSMLIADKSAGRINSSGTSATTHVYDEQSKININTANTLLLGNLVSRVFPSWSNGAVNTFVTKITGHVPCNNLNELIMNVPSGGNNHIEKTDLDTLRPFITVNSYRDPNCGNRAPININTCSQAALESIFEGLRGATGAAISANRAADIASAVIGMRPITCWTRFGDTIDTVAAITTAQSAAIKDNCNPNRTKPAPFTTEFCFNSGGYYTVTAAGSVTGALSAPIASNTLSAVVKIYGIYCETTKAQFEKGNEDKDYDGILDAGEDANGNGALDVPIRVTWLNTCPVKSTDLFGSDSIPSNAQTIDNSLKLGFWDNFDETNSDNTSYSRNNWIDAANDPIKSKYQVGDWNSSGNFNIHPDFTIPGGQPQYGKFRLSRPITGSGNSWAFTNFSMRVREKDFGWMNLLKTAGQLIIGCSGGDAVILEGLINPLKWDNWDSSACVWRETWAWDIPIVDNSGNPTGAYKTNPNGTRYFEWVPMIQQWSYKSGTCWITHYPTDQGPIIDLTALKFGDLHHRFDNQIRIWPNTNLTTGNPYTWNPGDNVTEYYAVCASYASEKVLNIKRTDSTITATRYVGATAPVGPVTKNDSFAGTALINLYCGQVFPYWDDIRIISPDGNFTSQVINSTLSSGMPVTGNVEWGTITGTVTVPGLLTIPPTTIAGSETVAFQTSSDNDKYPNGVKEWKATSATSGQIFSNAGNSIQYKASLATASSGINETPVLEDITITYLPKVSIKSFSVSQ